MCSIKIMIKIIKINCVFMPLETVILMEDSVFHLQGIKMPDRSLTVQADN